MADQTPQQLLREAAVKIETALVLLDVRESECGHCHTRRFANFAHAKTYKSFSDTPMRLRDAADRLDEKTEKALNPHR